MYVDYSYYAEVFHGEMPTDSFEKNEKKAEAYIRYLTYLNGDIFSKKDEAVKNSVCAVADIYYEEAKRQKINGGNGTVKSENNDGYSVTYVTEQTDGQTAEEILQKKAYDAAYVYLLPTGWLSRKARCGHAHKCGYNDL